MDYSLLAWRLGKHIREKRINRGYTQAKLAGLTRQKIIAVEKGALCVSMVAYARVLGALDCELTVIPAAMPTLEELAELF
ncbi:MULTISPECIES: helix-turn-helix transcriptional regulator [unclassified Pseudomonas]|uniref:helix-turn-helix transcriptional regulator n=1 Tax=unclassified Pseudomonas TaxID=196821 RepID=UPI0009D57DB8|nr:MULTISPECIES: transcriptional regulator [unclassified Pseudomonas]OPK10076.1 transcriptional regulator [Pseudomonas sp. VI4.1]QCY14755.1 transcriptional regulator [Pseudomonas sp. MPC6]